MSKTMFVLLGLMLTLVSVPAPAQQEAMTAMGPEVVEANLGRAVENREIMDETSTFVVNERVYLWLKVAGAAGDSITVLWKHGEHSYQTALAIGGSPWRTWAYKTAAFAGDWSVSVMDKDGNVLKELTFTVQETGMKEPSPKQ